MMSGSGRCHVDFHEHAKCEIEPDFKPDAAPLTGGKLTLTEALVAPRSGMRDLTLPEVYNAGAYRFTDFLKVGIPLNIIFWLLSSWLIPKFWPF